MTADEPTPDPLVEPGPELSDRERARFARHLLLVGVGETGQRRLRAARVLVIGAGGLGSPSLLYLAAAGVGRVTVIDDDEVDAGNLQRQVIHSTGTVGRPKVESARDRLEELGDFVDVRTVHGRIHHGNALELVGDHDLVLDGSDNFGTRYLVSDACEITGVPLVWATLDRYRGQVSVFWSKPTGGARAVTLRDLYPSPPPPGTVPTCAEGGIFGALCGQVGSMMSIEAIKLITGVGRSLLGRLALVDVLSGTTRTVNLSPDPDRVPVTSMEPDAEVAPGGETSTGGVAGVETVTAPQLADELRAGAPPVLLDVRTSGEREIAEISPSVWVPLAEVAEDVADPTGVLRRALDDADGGLVVYCKAGTRSAQAASLISAAGIGGVRSLAGGIDAWAEEVDPSMPRY